MDFTKDELDLLANAIDVLVRTEGQAMAQHGAGGLKGGRVDVLAARLTTGLRVMGKIDAERAEIAAAQMKAAAATAEPGGG